jgi:hypothetical protein
MRITFRRLYRSYAVIKTNSSLTSNAVDGLGALRDTRLAASDGYYHAAGFGLRMVRPFAAKDEEARLHWVGRLTPVVGLIAGLVPAVALAQTNIDEGKSPSQIFTSDCSVCHKTPKGLAKGRSAGGVAEFLRQHYTTGREQATALASFILGAGAGGGDARDRKPAAEHAGKPAEEAAKPSSIKQARRPPPKTEEPPGPAAKLQKPKDEEREEGDTKPEPIAVEEPAPKPSAKPPVRGRRAEPKPSSTASRSHPVSEPPAVHEAPSVAAAPATEAAHSVPAAAVPNAEPGEASPVPRDDIPD